MQALQAQGIDASSLPEAQLWTPVLGIGSNGSPEQLARKFLVAKYPHAVIPTVRCALKDFDVVYAPLISSYGSCTGKLATACSIGLLHVVQRRLDTAGSHVCGSCHTCNACMT